MKIIPNEAKYYLFFFIGNDEEIYWKKKEVQEKDEKSSHQRKLNYKNTKTRKYTVKQVNTLD